MAPVDCQHTSALVVAVKAEYKVTKIPAGFEDVVRVHMICQVGERSEFHIKEHLPC